jgi:hypothetical protein
VLGRLCAAVVCPHEPTPSASAAPCLPQTPSTLLPPPSRARTASSSLRLRRGVSGSQKRLLLTSTASSSKDMEGVGSSEKMGEEGGGASMHLHAPLPKRASSQFSLQPRIGGLSAPPTPFLQPHGEPDGRLLRQRCRDAGRGVDARRSRSHLPHRAAGRASGRCSRCAEGDRVFLLPQVRWGVKKALCIVPPYVAVLNKRDRAIPVAVRPGPDSPPILCAAAEHFHAALEAGDNTTSAAALALLYLHGLGVNKVGREGGQAGPDLRDLHSLNGARRLSLLLCSGRGDGAAAADGAR